MTTLLLQAGLIASVLLGSLIVILTRPSQSAIRLMLAFSGAYLLSVCVLDLMPEVYGVLAERSGLYLMAGFLVQLLLSYFSQGIEHGHLHSRDGALALPIVISLFLHSFLEGMALTADAAGTAFGRSLLSGVLLHNVPVAVVVTTVMFHLGMIRRRMYLIIALFALSAPAGSLLHTALGGRVAHIASFYHIVLAVVLGMLIHIATIILFETGSEHRYNSYKLVAIVTGMALALLSHLL